MPATLAASRNDHDVGLAASTDASLLQRQLSETSMQGVYKLFADLSSEMLESAQRGDWEEVSAREKKCAQLVEALRHRPLLTPTDDAERLECLRLMRKVLADDAAIRELASPWLEQLSQILRSHRGRRTTNFFR